MKFSMDDKGKLQKVIWNKQKPYKKIETPVFNLAAQK